jgi:hypothetical protein
MEGPLFHIFIEVTQVWVVVHRFKKYLPFVMLGQFLGEGRFTGSYISGDGNVHGKKFGLNIVLKIFLCPINFKFRAF